MKVSQERFEDAGEQDEDGYCDYYYAGTVFRFTEGRYVLVARRYEDELDRVSFLRCETKRIWGGWRAKGLERIPYEDPLFVNAVRYLVGSEAARQIDVLVTSDGYTPADLRMLGIEEW